MLPVLPFLAWIAAITSLVLLVVLWFFGDSRRRTLVLPIGCFVGALLCQFLGGSPTVGAAGLVVQTMLAIYLMFRWRLR